MKRKKLPKVLCLACLFILSSCGEHNEQTEYVTSPDGMFIAELITREVGLNSILMKVNLGTLEQKKKKKLEQIYKGTGLGALVYWDGPSYLVVVNCSGYIDQIENTYSTNAIYSPDELNRTIYVQAITASWANYNGKQVCSLGPRPPSAEFVESLRQQ